MSLSKLMVPICGGRGRLSLAMSAGTGLMPRPLAQSVAAAEMRLIPVGKKALASGTLPECFGAHDAVTLEGHLLAGCGDAVPALAFTSV